MTYLHGQTPAAHDQPSPRPFPSRLPPQEYPGHFFAKKNTTCGTFRFSPQLLSAATALAHHLIGLEETDDGIWSVFFNTVLLAKLDERDRILHD